MTQLLLAKSEQTVPARLVDTGGTTGVGFLAADFGRTERRGSPARGVVVMGGSQLRRNELRGKLDSSGWTMTAAPTVIEVAATSRRSLADVIVVIDELLDCPLTDALLDLQRVSPAPIVVLLTRGAEPTTATLALEIGADDVQDVTVPADELRERFEAILRRRRGWSGTTAWLHFGDVVVDTENRRVLCGGVDVQIAPAGFEILVALASHPRKVLSYADLHRITRHRAANTDAAHISHTVAEHVRRIRLAIEPQPHQPRWIKTVRGAGYRLDPRY